jgi:predicted ABC-type ATPase
LNIRLNLANSNQDQCDLVLNWRDSILNSTRAGWLSLTVAGCISSILIELAAMRFAFETTLSGHVYARMIPEWRAADYRVRLIFLSLPYPEMAISRVAMRVAQGGHHVSSTVVRRRFAAGLRNFQEVYSPLVDKWEWYDNSGNTPQLISEEGNWG